MFGIFGLRIFLFFLLIETLNCSDQNYSSEKDSNIEDHRETLVLEDSNGLAENYEVPRPTNVLEN
ncbi:hypothetical protein, conserved, partial [Plasmodium malariae]